MHRSCTPGETRVVTTHLVLPPHTNNHGTMFGGQVSAWLDIAASVSAQRFARKPVVTASIDELHFLRPVRLGMIVELQAQVNQAWRTSMEIGVRVEAEDPRSGERIHCCSAYLTFVALDATGRPSPLPTLEPSGEPEWERRAREAQARRDHRLRMREERRSQR
ncbi:MAG: acyl-CoA thioesterase [Alphaproteobacteria bacterium]|nr:acyl-CoA thioesterase [Alphaproteobacteria bacterium]